MSKYDAAILLHAIAGCPAHLASKEHVLEGCEAASEAASDALGATCLVLGCWFSGDLSYLFAGKSPVFPATARSFTPLGHKQLQQAPSDTSAPFPPTVRRRAMA